MIAGFYKIQYVNIASANLPMAKVLGKSVLPSLALSEIVLPNGSAWKDLGVEREASELKFSPNSQSGIPVYESSIPIYINNVSPAKMIELAALDNSRVLALLTDNNDNTWMLGLPNTPAVLRVGISNDADPVGTNAFALELQVKQVFLPIPVTL